MERGREMCFSQQSEEAFSYHYTMQAARNLALSYTPAVKQTSNTCMATVAVNSNESSSKTRFSSILSSLLRKMSSSRFLGECVKPRDCICASGKRIISLHLLQTAVGLPRS